MLILNFSHPLMPEHVDALRRLTGQADVRVEALACQFDHARPFGDQARELLDRAALSAAEWQTAPLMLNLPSLSAIAGVLLAEVHGRAGYFPPIVRLRPVPNQTPPRFEVAEIVNLQQVRDVARVRRT